MHTHLIAWNRIKARLELAGFRVLNIENKGFIKTVGGRGLQFNANIFQQGGFSNASKEYHNEVKAIVSNEMEGNALYADVKMQGLNMTLTLI